MPRLFTALEIPRDAALSLSLLRGGLPGARWIDVENYHITLRFIGDIEGHVADEIANALDRVVGHLPAAAVGCRRFRRKEAAFVWAGVEASPDIRRCRVRSTASASAFGVPADPRKFTPHVTSGAAAQHQPDRCRALSVGTRQFLGHPFKVGRFVLMSSRDSVGGGPYVIEEAWPLAGDEARQTAQPPLSDAWSDWR